jgi:hypothetical protein
MDVVTFTTVAAAEDAVGCVFVHDLSRRLADFVPSALGAAADAAIAAAGASTALLSQRDGQDLYDPAAVRVVALKPDDAVEIALYAVAIDGPFGPVGSAVKAGSPQDDARLEDWLSAWRAAQRPS